MQIEGGLIQTIIFKLNQILYTMSLSFLYTLTSGTCGQHSRVKIINRGIVCHTISVNWLRCYHNATKFDLLM